MPTVGLSGRTIIDVRGDEAESFLQNILTTDLDELRAGEARAGALLTPQGKILFDFLISRNGDRGFALECRSELSADLIRRLMLYRLRAKAEIAQRDESLVLVSWHSESSGSQSDSIEITSGLADTRFPEALRVRRRYSGIGDETTASDTDWLELRISNGVAESGTDYVLGDAFPHDVLLDQNGGVSFKKGCFVGQEVVSRMQHRGTARKRIVIAQGNAGLPEPGTEIRAGSRTIGTLGSVSGRSGLALVRTDRAAEAMNAGTPILADDVLLQLAIPEGSDFSFPGVRATMETD